MTIEAISYSSEAFTATDDPAAARAAPGITWIRASQASPAEIQRIADEFDLHQLTIDDVLNDVRPKTEEFPRYTFVLVKDAELTRGETTFEDEIGTAPIGVYIGDDWLVTLAPGADEPVNGVWAAIERRDERILERGADFAAYRVIDEVVDEYFDVLDTIETHIERIEDGVVDSTDSGTIEAINRVRRDLLSFRRVAWPSREAVSVLARGDADQIDPATEKYYRDVSDHLVQVVEFIEVYRDLVSGARDIYLNTLSQSTNEVMKALTIVATVFLPLTFVVGIYGMNFDGSPFNMPELSWTFGYPAVMLGMLLVTVVLLWFFRERDYV